MSEDRMAFPNTWEEFEKEYGFTDTDEIYTNGSRLIQSFRVEQWLEHLDAVPVRHGKWIHEVRYTIDSLHSYQQYKCSECDMAYITNTNYCPNCGARMDEK